VKKIYAMAVVVMAHSTSWVIYYVQIALEDFKSNFVGDVDTKGVNVNKCITCNYPHVSIPKGEMCLACIDRYKGKAEGDRVEKLRFEGKTIEVKGN